MVKSKLLYLGAQNYLHLLTLSLRFNSKCLDILRMIDQMPDGSACDVRFKMNLHSTFQFKGRFSWCQESHWLYWFWKIISSSQFLFLQTSCSSMFAFYMNLGVLVNFFFFYLSPKKSRISTIRMSLHFQSKCDKANLQTLLGRIKLFKVNSKKKNNLNLSRISWEIHLWYLLFELLSLLFSSQHSTSPCPASSASSPPRPPPSSSPSSFPAIFSGESTVWARIWD